MTNKKQEFLRAQTLASGLEFDAKKFEFKSEFVPADTSNPWEVHTTAELVACLEKRSDIELDARVLTREGSKQLHRESFVESYHGNNVKLREMDPFSVDGDVYGNLVGQDFAPFLGGPFYKNLYFYQDYIRMHSASFYAYHNDPHAKAIISILRDFTLGRGFRVDSEDKEALALWHAFSEVNDLQCMMEQVATELPIYGEELLWWLPNQEANITYQLRPGDTAPTALLPRVKLIDPSNIVEIITYPEDISRRIAYIWLAPTQFQIYTKGQKSDQVQPSLKFIYRQIPADQVDHFTINGVSNEKRGRSDLFPVLGYLKRLRDAVDYEMIAHMKQSAWAIDTSIEGSQSDIDAYIQSQVALGTITQAGSEFVHTSKIKREFVSPQSGSGGSEEIFKWCLSMISAGTQIPVSYFGTHLSGGQTRASAVVATEPVAKKFEMRQLVYERMIKKMWSRLMKWAGKPGVTCEITFPDIITQDRTAKLRDLAMSQAQGWISKERAASIAAKELGITEYDYNQEQEQMKAEEPEPSDMAPLSMAPKVQPSSGLSGQDRRDIKKDGVR